MEQSTLQRPVVEPVGGELVENFAGHVEARVIAAEQAAEDRASVPRGRQRNRQQRQADDQNSDTHESKVARLQPARHRRTSKAMPASNAQPATNTSPCCV